jgi:hypothetical protein
MRRVWRNTFSKTDIFRGEKPGVLYPDETK